MLQITDVGEKKNICSPSFLLLDIFTPKKIVSKNRITSIFNNQSYYE